MIASTDIHAGKPPTPCMLKCNQYRPAQNHAKPKTNATRAGRVTYGNNSNMPAKLPICMMPEGNGAKLNACAPPNTAASAYHPICFIFNFTFYPNSFFKTS